MSSQITVKVMHATEQYILEVPVGTTVAEIRQRIMDNGLDQHGCNPDELVMWESYERSKSLSSDH